MTISILQRPLRSAVEKRFDEPQICDAGGATEFAAQVKERLRRRLTRECEAMAQYALSTGRVVPIEVMERLDQAMSASDGLAAVVTPGRRDGSSPADAAAHDASTTEMSGFVSLAVAHAGLATAIAPATPETVLVMFDEHERHPLWSRFGPLPLVRQMLGLALVSLVVLLAANLSEAVSSENLTKSWLDLSGYSLLMIEAFLVSAASLGATFANLQRINVVISDGNYDPRFQSTYWARWVMGVISGIVLSQIVYDFFVHSEGATTHQAIPSVIGQPLLALLGGYSVDFVHGLLRRAINTVGSFFGVAMDQGTDNRRAPRRS